MLLQRFALVLFAVSYLLFSPPQLRAATTGTGGPTVQFASSSYTVNESDGTATLTVTLTKAVSSVVTVNFATTDGTAVAGTDYTAASGTVTFPANTTSQTVSVGIMDNDNYTDQTVSFTVTLSQPANATLGSPSVSTVNILDNDPAPTADIEINGVAKAQKNNPGGYVQVNANNDNGSMLTYVDGVTQVPKGTSGIPKMRDFDPKNINLQNGADPDIIQITLQTQNLKIGGPENIVLSVSSPQNPPPKQFARIQIWDAGTKNNMIGTPTNWTVKTIPASVFVEGLHESSVLQDTIILQLQILNKGNVVATDTCVLTITPVLSKLAILVANGAIPGIDPQGSPNLLSSPGIAAQTVTMSTSAQWNQIRGKLRIIQNASFGNGLPGGVGADLGPRTLDFGGKYATKNLVDCAVATIPFYQIGGVDGGIVANVYNYSAQDTPQLSLLANQKAAGTFSVAPAVNAATKINVSYNFLTYATVAFSDNSIYCIGQQSWSVNWVGTVNQAVANTYTYVAGNGNANTGSGQFGVGVLNNANPMATGPDVGNDPVTAAAGWR